MKRTKEITFTLHDKPHAVKTAAITPETTLLQYLRDYELLKGTKYMCLEGGCGSCVVAITTRHPVTKKSITFSVNSCLVSIYSCQDWTIHTIEGIGNKQIGYHPVQKRLAEFNGTQCGFCSPGMVMNMYPLYESGNLTMKEVEDSFGGNLCRCTGYRSILTAFKSLAADANAEILGHCPDIEDLERCAPNSNCAQNCRSPCWNSPSLRYTTTGSKWYKVFSINEIFDVFLENPGKSYQLVAGNTARGVYHQKTIRDFYVDVTSVPTLTSFSLENNRLIIGANYTLNDTIELFKTISKNKANFAYLDKLAQHIGLVAHVSVRNIGTLIGNLFLKHDHPDFPSDIFLIFETVGAVLTIMYTSRLERQYTVLDFLSLNTSRKVVKNIILPGLDKDAFKYGSYKIMPRAQNAHAMVNAGFLLKLNRQEQVLSATLVYGGISSSFAHATNTERYLLGKSIFSDATLQMAFEELNREVQPDDGPAQPSSAFRKNLAIALFYKFILSIAPVSKISPENKSGGKMLTRPISTGIQDFQTNKSLYPLTEPIPKLEALRQTTGDVKYVMDLTKAGQELHACFVVAKAEANSIIRKVDTSAALKLEGVVAYYDKNDIPGRNTFFPKTTNYPVELLGNTFVEEELFCSGVVQYFNQPVGVIVAKNQDLAEEAADLVVIKYYSATKKPLLTIKQVVEAKAVNKIVHEGSLVATHKGKNTKHIVKGPFETRHQYHFHMETHVSLVVPKDDSYEIHSSTQWKDHIQTGVATVLNVLENKIDIIVARVGGAYGGKVTRSTMVACGAALAAYKLLVPVKMRMSFSSNMDVIGKRFPHYGTYEVGIDDKGKIQHLDYFYYLDYGVIGNEPIAFGTMDILYSSYGYHTWNVNCNSTRTDTTPAQYTRGPGHTTTLAAIESIMEHIAMEINVSPFDVRTANMDPIANKKILGYMSDVKQWSDYERRQQLAEQFNQSHRWTKRGLTVVPMTFPIVPVGSYSATVAIYAGDGTVAVSHGGIEMGQGINTKVAQVCAFALGIPLNMVSIKPSSNLISPNNFASVRSTTSEAVCYATLKSCQALLARMQPVKDKMVNPTWQEVVKQCQLEYVELIASYMYSPKDKPEYNIYAACVAEVEVDILTGLHQVLRVDLIEDVGNSMSPNVDIGQVEGAFVMGLGFWTTEELMYTEKGQLLTNRTWTFKPPGALDIPIDFRVKFPKNNPNPVGVLSSKATGEPAICLSVSIPLAIRHAVASARMAADPTVPRWYAFDGPSTVENTFMNSLNDFKQYRL